MSICAIHLHHKSLSDTHVHHVSHAGAGDLYLAAMDAIYPINNNVLFFIEGTGQQGIADNWGDGIATSKSAIAAAGVSDPNAFFTSLMGRPYLNQVLKLPG